MNLIPNMLPEALVRALGWTLLHSLWQGAFVALLLGLLLILLHRHTARLRYIVAGGAMLAQLLLSAGTFAYCYARAAAPAIPAFGGSAGAVSINAGNSAAVPVVLNFWQNPTGVAQVYFEQHLPLLVTVWLLGLLLMALRFTGGVAYTQRLRHYKTTPLPQAWQNRLQVLGQRIGFSRPVQLVESALVQVPMVIGFASPVILLPTGAVAGLSPKQLEAILAHELAHILRKDYLLNLLQSAADLLFFYHPAMWWISGVVRAERENCCDDMAVALCGDTLTYARALAELEAMRLPAAPALAMAFSGRRGTLTGRIKRLVEQQSLRPTFSEGFLAALVLIIGLLGLSFGAVAGLHTTVKSSEEDIPELLAVQSATFISGAADKALPISDDTENVAAAEEAANAFVYAVQDSAGQQQDVVIIKNKKGKVTDLYVNGRRIPKKDIPEYNKLVEQQLAAINRAPKATDAEVKRSINAARAAVAEARRQMPENSVYNYDFNYNFRFDGDSLVIPPVPPIPPLPPMPAIPPMPPLPPMPQLDGDTPASKQERKKYEAGLKEYEKQIKKYADEISERYKNSGIDEQRIGQQEARQVEMASRQMEQAEHQRGMLSREVEQAQHQQETDKRHEEQAKRNAEMAARHAEMAERREEQALRREEMARQREVQADRTRQLKQELVEDDLIEDKAKNLSVQLNDSAFYINGKKQPKAVYEKYKKLLRPEGGKSGNFNLQYNEN